MNAPDNEELSEESRLSISLWAAWIRRSSIAAGLVLLALWGVFIFFVCIIFLEVGVQRLNEREAGYFFFFAFLGLGALAMATTAVARLWQAGSALSNAHISTENMEIGVRHLGSFWMWLLWTMVGGIFIVISLLMLSLSSGY